MKWIFWIFLCLQYTVSWPQSQEKYTVKPGEKILDIIPQKEIYSYPEFILGTVVFRNGLSSTGKLNYNALTASVEFIDEKGDSLSLANEETIKHIVISKDTFYYSDGYLRLVTAGASLKLGERRNFKEFVQKPGAYGLSSETTATNNISVILERRSYAMNTDQEIVLVKNTSYLFGNKFNQFLKAEKKNLLKMFPKLKTAIDDYLNKNAVDFNKKEDLINLTAFLNGL